MSAGTDAKTAEHTEHGTRTRSRPRRRWPLLLVLLAAVAAGIVVLAVGFGRDPGVVDSALVGRPAPSTSGETLDGGQLDLADLRGDVVLVNVWASWCGPCRREFPLLQRAADELGPAGLRVVGIDTQDDPDDARAFLRRMRAEYADQSGVEPGPLPPSIVDPQGRLAVEWGTFGVPETFVVGRDGTVVDRRVGEVSAEWIRDAVVPLL